MAERKKSEDYESMQLESAIDTKENDALVSPSGAPAAALGLRQSLSRMDSNSPLSVLAYCLSSISMTVVNKYVVSGDQWNLAFFYLTAQVGCTHQCRPVLYFLLQG